MSKKRKPEPEHEQLSRPEQQVVDLIAELRNRPLLTLEHRVRAALRRDMTGYNRADGFKSTTMGEGGNAELTSVEAAAERRANLDGSQRYDRDMHHEHTINAVQFIMDAANALGAAEARMDEIDRLVEGELPSNVGRYTGGGNCLACNRPVPGGEKDRLRAGLCDACRKAWERQGRPDRQRFIAQRRPYDDPEHVPTQQPA